MLLYRVGQAGVSRRASFIALPFDFCILQFDFRQFIADPHGYTSPVERTRK